MPDEAPDPNYDPNSATIPMSGPRPTLSGGNVDLPLPEELTKLLPPGAYEITDFLGAGGMGAVYKGMQVRLKRPVAIKIMRRDMGRDHDFEARFEREAQAMAKLNHPNIISVIDFGEAGPDYLFIVMELVDGTDLMEVIRSKQMTQEMALGLLPQICDALQFAHDHGIVHRDIKPGNIMLTRDGRVKMADFGLAKHFDVVDSGFRTQTGTGMGTPDYAAPEQFDPTTPIDHRADIYALGVMIYQMITGSLPRGVWRPPSQRAEVAPQWDAVVSRAMQNDPADRYQKASEVKTELGTIALVKAKTASPKQPTAPKPGALGQSAQPQIKPGAPLLFGVIVGAAVIAIAAFFAFKKSDQGGVTAPSATASGPATNTSSTESWQDALRDPTKLRLERSVEKTAEGLRFTGAGSVSLASKSSPQHDIGLRMQTTFGGVRPNLQVRASNNGNYLLYVRNESHVNLTRYNEAPKNTTSLGDFLLREPLKPGQEYVLELRVVGQVITAKFNGDILGSATDSALPQGGFGVSVIDSEGSPTLIRSLEILDLDKTDAISPPPGPQVSKTFPQFPPGQWVKLFTKVEDLPSFLTKPSGDVAWKDGWIRPRKKTFLELPEELQGNYALRMRYVRESAPDEHAQFSVRRRDGAMHAQYALGGSSLALLRMDGSAKDVVTLAKPALPAMPAPGTEGTLELGVVGGRLIGRVNGYYATSLDTTYARGRAQISTGEPIRDIEVINLDDLPEAEALRLLDADVAGNDVRGENAVPPSQSPGPQVSNASVATATKDTPYVNSLGMKFVPVPITGGSANGHRVLFSVWDTRVQDYAVFVNMTKRGWPKAGDVEQGSMHPAVNVTWEDAQAFCAWLTERERTTGKIGPDERYRLPKDHEWSCAAGIGEREDAAKLPSEKIFKIENSYPWGAEWPPPEHAGNYRSAELQAALAAGKFAPTSMDPVSYSDGFATTSPVGSFPANRLGIYDMGGNVWQWCEEWFHAPQSGRVARGAAWSIYDQRALLSSHRYHGAPGFRGSAVGFRCVLESAGP